MRDLVETQILTCNSSVESIIFSSVKLQSIVNRLPQEREHAKERSESNCISAKERVFEDGPEGSSSCGVVFHWLFRSVRDLLRRFSPRFLDELYVLSLHELEHAQAEVHQGLQSITDPSGA